MQRYSELFGKIFFVRRIRRRRVRRKSRKSAKSKKNRIEYLKYKEVARELVRKKVEEFAGVYGFKFGKISVRNQRTRWGSCSRKGNLNFNYKIALLPARLADYIVVHELCHLGEFNHSQKFWDLVAKTMPDYLALRAELRKHAKIL